MLRQVVVLETVFCAKVACLYFINDGSPVFTVNANLSSCAKKFYSEIMYRHYSQGKCAVLYASDQPISEQVKVEASRQGSNISFKYIPHAL